MGHGEVPQGTVSHHERIIEASQKRGGYGGDERPLRSAERLGPRLVGAELDGPRLEAVGVAGDGVRPLEGDRALIDERRTLASVTGKGEDLVDNEARTRHEVFVTNDAVSLAFHASHSDELLSTDMRCIPPSLSGWAFALLQEYAAPRGSRTRCTMRTSTSGTAPSTNPYDGSFDESTTSSLLDASATARYSRESVPR